MRRHRLVRACRPYAASIDADLKVALQGLACRERAEETKAKLKRAPGLRTWSNDAYDSAVAAGGHPQGSELGHRRYGRF